jgi:hypothetical protein
MPNYKQFDQLFQFPQFRNGQFEIDRLRITVTPCRVSKLHDFGCQSHGRSSSSFDLLHKCWRFRNQQMKFFASTLWAAQHISGDQLPHATGPAAVITKDSTVNRVWLFYRHKRTAFR